MSFCFMVGCIAAVDPAAASFAALALSRDESVRTREKNRRLGGFPSRLRKEGPAGTGLAAGAEPALLEEGVPGVAHEIESREAVPGR
jgi:hypothetical protein